MASVPSDAPDDYAALIDIQRKKVVMQLVCDMQVNHSSKYFLIVYVSKCNIII